MKFVFADTLTGAQYLHPIDQYRAPAIHAQATLGDIGLVTTDEVLFELLDGLGSG